MATRADKNEIAGELFGVLAKAIHDEGLTPKEVSEIIGLVMGKITLDLIGEFKAELEEQRRDYEEQIEIIKRKPMSDLTRLALKAEKNG